MKTSLYLLICLFFVAGAGGVDAADVEGFAMSKVVTADFPAAVAMTEEGADSDATIYVDPSPLLTTGDVRKASVIDHEGAVIHMEFTEAGEAKLRKATEALVKKKIALIVDGKLTSAPVVMDVFGSPIEISGNFTLEWAKSVVERINIQLEGK